jgi:hypothetical protein
MARTVSVFVLGLVVGPSLLVWRSPAQAPAAPARPRWGTR